MLYSAILMSFYIKALYQNPSPVRLKIGLYNPNGFIEGDSVKMRIPSRKKIWKQLPPYLPILVDLRGIEPLTS